MAVKDKDRIRRPGRRPPADAKTIASHKVKVLKEKEAREKLEERLEAQKIKEAQAADNAQWAGVETNLIAKWLETSRQMLHKKISVFVDGKPASPKAKSNGGVKRKRGRPKGSGTKKVTAAKATTRKARVAKGSTKAASAPKGTGRKRGRPKGSKNKPKDTATATPAPKATTRKRARTKKEPTTTGRASRKGSKGNAFVRKAAEKAAQAA